MFPYVLILRFSVYSVLECNLVNKTFSYVLVEFMDVSLFTLLFLISVMSIMHVSINYMHICNIHMCSFHIFMVHLLFLCVLYSFPCMISVIAIFLKNEMHTIFVN